MTMKFEGSLQLGFINSLPDPSLLSNAINTAVSDFGSELHWDSSTYTLSISKSINAGDDEWTISIPFFYVAVASFDAKLELTLTGDMESVTLSAKVDACIDLAGDLADLASFVDGGDTSLCASQLPNCAGDPSFSCTSACYDLSPCTCKWIGDTWPCYQTTGYTNDCGLDWGHNVDVNSARTAAATVRCVTPPAPHLISMPLTPRFEPYRFAQACGLLGSPDVRKQPLLRRAPPRHAHPHHC